MSEKIYRNKKCQTGRSLSRIEEDGRNWLRRPKFCIKSCRAIIIIISSFQHIKLLLIESYAIKYRLPCSKLTLNMAVEWGWGESHSIPGQNIRYPNHRRRSLGEGCGGSLLPSTRNCTVELSDRILVNFAQKCNVTNTMEYKIIPKESGSWPATGWKIQGSNSSRGKATGACISPLTSI
jgi:hypothetical protein